MAMAMTVIVDNFIFDETVWHDNTSADSIFKAQLMYWSAELCQHAISDSLLLEIFEHLRIRSRPR